MKRLVVIRAALLVLLAATFILSAAAQDLRAAPANNNFADRIVITPRQLMNGLFTVTSAHEATIQEGEPVPSCASPAAIFDTIWYEFSSIYELHLGLTTFESTLNNNSANHNTVIAVYTSTTSTPTLGTLTQQLCSENGLNEGFFSWISIQPSRYFLQIGSSTNLTTASTYVLDFGSRYQLLGNTSFGVATPALAPWVVTNKTGDKVICGISFPRAGDECHFRFKTSPNENSILTYTRQNLAALPHNTGPTSYSELIFDVDVETERSVTNAKAIIAVTFTGGTKEKMSRSLDTNSALYIDPDSGKTPVKAVLKITHKGKSGAPLYITQVRLLYVVGATGRDTAEADILPPPPPPY